MDHANFTTLMTKVMPKTNFEKDDDRIRIHVKGGLTYEVSPNKKELEEILAIDKHNAVQDAF